MTEEKMKLLQCPIKALQMTIMLSTIEIPDDTPQKLADDLNKHIAKEAEEKDRCTGSKCPWWRWGRQQRFSNQMSLQTVSYRVKASDTHGYCGMAGAPGAFSV